MNTKTVTWCLVLLVINLLTTLSLYHATSYKVFTSFITFTRLHWTPSWMQESSWLWLISSFHSNWALIQLCQPWQWPEPLAQASNTLGSIPMLSATWDTSRHNTSLGRMGRWEKGLHGCVYLWSCWYCCWMVTVGKAVKWWGIIELHSSALLNLGLHELPALPLHLWYWWGRWVGCLYSVCVCWHCICVYKHDCEYLDNVLCNM